MKRILLLALLCMSAHVAMSQDVIVTKQSERIDGKVEEISETEIKYRPKTNPTGPLMVISASKVATIMFENGQVYAPAMIEHLPESAPQTEAQIDKQQNEIKAPLGSAPRQAIISSVSSAQSAMQSGDKYWYGNHHIEYTPGQPIIYSKQSLTRGGDKFWYGDHYMKKAEYKHFIKLHCDDAWRIYRRYRVWGGIMGWGSLGVLYVNTILTPLLLSSNYSSGGLAAFLVTEGIFLSSMTFGFILWNSAGCASVKKFNSTCSSHDYKAALSLNANPTGFGLTFNF